MSEKTCAERIEDRLHGRAAQMLDLYDRAEAFDRGDSDDEDAAEEARDEMWELPLSVEVVKTIKVLLSTGGPADGLTIELDTDGNVSSVRYWFADWFDHAETKVDQDSPLWHYAEDIAESMHGVDQ